MRRLQSIHAQGDDTLSGPRFIVRVDDVGQSLEQHERDARLEHFRKWLNAWGTLDEPIYLGVVPTFCDPYAIGYLAGLSRGVRIALHGYNHWNQVLTPEHIEMASHYFPQSRWVIPPYNAYDEQTIAATWCLAQSGQRPVLFGGFNDEHHHYGEAPCIKYGVLHLSARRDLYSHSYRLIEAVAKIEDPGYPLQIVLHWRWDAPFLSGVTKLHKALEGRLASTDELVI